MHRPGRQPRRPADPPGDSTRPARRWRRLHRTHAPRYPRLAHAPHPSRTCTPRRPLRRRTDQTASGAPPGSSCTLQNGDVDVTIARFLKRREFKVQPMSIVAIINPISGAGADPAVASRRVDLLTAEAKRRGLDADIRLTTHAGHAREIAAESAAAGVDLVIVWGGDGTLNEAGAGLLGSATAIGLVPAGSGNGLAAALGVPRDPLEALALAFDGATRTIDAGMIAGRPFFNIAGVGFDARIAKLFNQRGGRRGGWPYVVL